jgi:hypothetical protein
MSEVLFGGCYDILYLSYNRCLFFAGIVLAIHGKETSEGDFFVEDFLEAGLAPQVDRPLDYSKVLPESVHH